MKNEIIINGLIFTKTDIGLYIDYPDIFGVNIAEETIGKFHAWLTDQLGLGWVSVSDRLPDRTPVADEKTVFVNGYEADGFYNHDYRIWYVYNQVEGCFDIGDPTHWREKTPLPAPPEGE